MLYWGIGKEILKRQEEGGWDSKVIDRLSKDLRGEFLDMQGFSSRNLKYMRKLAKSWSDDVIVQQVAAQILWLSNRILLARASLSRLQLLQDLQQLLLIGDGYDLD
jgi:predicted nuclease of restriction endonuclease-like (RecB) superfamily